MNEIQICQPEGTDSFETFLLAPGKVVLRSAGGVSADYSMQTSTFRLAYRLKKMVHIGLAGKIDPKK